MSPQLYGDGRENESITSETRFKVHRLHRQLPTDTYLLTDGSDVTCLANAGSYRHDVSSDNPPLYNEATVSVFSFGVFRSFCK